MAEVNRLEIVVTAETKEAESSISSLCKRLAELQGRINAISIKGLGQKISSISKALDAGKTVKDLGSVNKAVEKTARTLTKTSKVEDPYWSAEAIRQRSLANLDRVYKESVAAQNANRMQTLLERHGGVNPITGYKATTGRFSWNKQAYQENLDQYTKRRSWGGVGADELGKSAQAAMQLAENLDKAGASAEETKAKIADLAEKMNSGSVSPASVLGSEAGGASSALADVGSSISSAVSQIPGFTDAVESAGSALSSFVSAAGRLAMTGLGKFFQASISPITSFANRLRDVGAGLKSFFNRFKRMAVLRLFRQMINEIGKGLSEGINNLYQYSAAINGGFKGALDSAATSMQYFKNSIGAAAAPLIQAFIPYINAAISAIVSFINILNQLFSALGGALSFTRAKKSVTEFGKAAKGAGGGAKKAAKEMDKFLASWDEITNIKPPDDPSGGGGGGGSAVDYQGMFEEAAISPELLDFASRIREAFDAGKWEEVGKIVADKLNEILPDDAWFENWGRRFGEKINMAFGIALGFLRNFDFKALGSRIAAFLNGGINSVNWANIGAYLWRRLSSAFDIAIGFISTFDTKGATTAISNLLIGMWNETTAWLGETDWSEFGRTVAGKLLDAIAGIKWIELITSAWDLAKAAVSATWGFFSGFVIGLFSELWEGIKAGLAETEIGKAFTEWWNQVQAVWGPVAEWFSTNVIGPIKEFFAPLGEAITGFLKDPIGTIQQAWAKEVEWWSTNVIEPIKMKFAPIKEAIEGFLNDPIGTIQQAWTSVAEWFNTTFIVPVVGYFDSLKANIELAFEAARQFVIDAWSGVSEWFSTTVIEPLKLVFEPIKTAIEGFLNDPIGTIQLAWTTFAEWFNTTFIIPVTNYFNSLKANIELGFEAAKQFIMDAWLTLAEWFNTTFITPVVNYFNSLKANIELAFEAAKQFVMDAWLTVSEWFSTNVTTPIHDVFSPLEGAITGFLSNPVGAIKQAWIDIKSWFARNIIQPISSAFSNLGNTIKSAFFGAINTVIGGLNSFVGLVNSIGIDFNGWSQTYDLGFLGTYTVGIPGIHLKPFNLPTIPTIEYAEGGFPSEGEMFIAREAGPELVGRMGNRSAVANNDQIVEGIRQGVYEAMVAANNAQGGKEVRVYIDGKDITDYTRKRQNQMARALGV